MKQYLELYKEAHKLLCEHSAAIMNVQREKAFAALIDAQFPTRKCETYRYTDVSNAFAPDYGLNLSRLDIPVNPYEAFRCDVPNLSASVYFVINDTFNTQCLPAATLPQGVIVDSLSRIANEHPEWVTPFYDKIEYTHEDTIPRLNTMLAQDGVFIRIPKGIRLERPLQIVNILRSDVDMMVNRRMLVVMEEDAEATLLVCDHTADDRQFLITEVSEVFVGQNSHLQMYSLEENSNHANRFTNLYIRQEKNSRLTHATMTLNTGLSCNRTRVYMNGEGADCKLYGAVIADKQQHVDHGTVIVHNAPACNSKQLYKYVLDGKATGAFAGRIIVPHNMQRSVSDMVNANLITNADAHIYTQPMLEIYADDVQCSHGCTVGQLSDDALVYMRQRGIPEDEARLLLKQAFANQVIESIELPALRDRLYHLVEKRFRGELAHCDCCRLCNKI